MVIVSGLVSSHAFYHCLIAIYVSLLGRNSSLDSSSKWREVTKCCFKVSVDKDDSEVKIFFENVKHDNKDIVVSHLIGLQNIMIVELERTHGTLSKCSPSVKKCSKVFSEIRYIKVVRLFANFYLSTIIEVEWDLINLF